MIKNTGILSITNSGVLAYYIPVQYGKYLQTRMTLQLSLKANQENKFPMSSIGYLYSRASYAGRGFLLNDNIVVTAASCVYDRKKKKKRENLIFSLPIFKTNVNECCYPPEYENCEESESWKFNYALVSLGEKEILSETLLTIISEFEE